MLSFGTCPVNVKVWDRVAAYVVVRDGASVATVRPKEKHFLPGGGSRPGETPEATVRREVREELARELGDMRKLGVAVQYFYSSDDDRHYRVHAHFFTADFTGLANGKPENELQWLSPETAATSLFHECHQWAIRERP